MNLIKDAQRAKLKENGNKHSQDNPAIVKLFIENTPFIYLISEMDSGDEDCVFGLLDTGLGEPRLTGGLISVVKDLAVDIGRKLVNDPDFEGNHPMSAYVDAARKWGRIVDLD